MSTIIETVTIGNTIYRLSDTQALEAITALSTTPVDYTKIINKPSINGKELTGNITIKEGIQYNAGTGISISADGVISCTVEGGGSEYTAGNGISISADNEISIKGVPQFDGSYDSGFIGLYTDEDGLHFTTNLIVTKQELGVQLDDINSTLGDINSILDKINGEVI